MMCFPFVPLAELALARGRVSINSKGFRPLAHTALDFLQQEGRVQGESQEIPV